MEETEPNPLAALLGINEAFEPLFDAGKGIRAHLESEGWSSEAAEDIAKEFTIGMIRKAMKGS